jgi:hypothetical protein
MTEYFIRKALPKDYPELEKLIAVSARELSQNDYTHTEIENAKIFYNRVFVIFC